MSFVEFYCVLSAGAIIGFFVAAILNIGRCVSTAPTALDRALDALEDKKRRG
jgi:hypothetical protein